MKTLWRMVGGHAWAIRESFFFNISEKKVNALMKLLFPELLGPISIFIFANSRFSALIFLKLRQVNLLIIYKIPFCRSR